MYDVHPNRTAESTAQPANTITCWILAMGSSVDQIQGQQLRKPVPTLSPIDAPPAHPAARPAP
jgi:hypothetical protein